MSTSHHDPLDVGDAPFVGRAELLGALVAAFGQLGATGARMAVLTGPAGIGKTRLARELEGRARTRGSTTLFAWCYEGEGAPPYWPWAALIRGYLREVEPEQARRVLGPSGADLAAVVPEVQRLLAVGSAGDAPASPESEFRLFYAVASFLREAARERPLLVSIDDAQWADASSIRLLSFVARELRDAPVLILLTLRDDGELAVTATQRSELYAMLRGGESLHLPVGPLATAEIAAFVEARLGAGADRSLVGPIAARSEGNPLFVTELLRSIEAPSGGLAKDARRRVEEEIPGAIQGIVLRRLERLSPDCVDLVRLVAVLGREFSLGLLRRAAKDDPADAIEEAFATGIFCDHPERAGFLRFRHGLIPQVVRGQLGPIERLDLHRRWLEVLSEEEDRAAVAGELAEHAMVLARAGSAPEPAVLHARRAGEVALRAFAHAEAARYFGRALEATELCRSVDPVDLGELLLDTAEAYRRAGDPAGARSAIERASACARRGRAPELLARAALARAPGFFASAGGEDLGGRLESGAFDPDLLRAFDEALEALPEQALDLRARLLARRAIAATGGSDERERASTSEQALEIAERSGDPLTLAYAIGARHTTLGRAEDFATRREWIGRLRSLGPLVGDLELSLMQRVFWISSMLESGDIEGVDREIEACARSATELRLPRSRWYAESYRAMRHFMAGRFREALELLRALLAEAEAAQDRAGAFMLQLRIALVSSQLGGGGAERAGELMSAGTQAHPQMKFFEAGLAKYFIDADRPDDARKELDRLARHDFADVPHNETWGLTIGLLADVAASLGDRARSEILYRALAPASGRFIVLVFAAGVFDSADRLLGGLARTTGDLERAASHFERGLVLARESGARPVEAQILHDYARCLLERASDGDTERARARFAEAAALARELGMARLIARIERSAQAEPTLEATPTTEAKTAVATARAGAPQPVPAGAAGCVLRREGDYWTIAFEGHISRVRDLRGLAYLAVLLANAHRAIPALELAASADATPTDGPAARATDPESTGLAGDAGELLDDAARREYAARLREIESDLADAQRDADLGRSEQLQIEREFLTAELSRAVGLGGRARVAGSPSERARVRVTRAIRKAIDHIARANAPLGEHLRASIRTGRDCSYEPTLHTQPSWET